MNSVETAAALIREAQAVVVTAGAGMGVDSGLPDFRGDQGFWKAYPAYQRLGLSFVDLANPAWFDRDPELAWGFYGHRLGLYRQTVPHEGFAGLLRLIGDRPRFVFTSNVDGQFQRAGFSDEGIHEVHGSVGFLQCSVPCASDLWSSDDLEIQVDPVSFRATSPLPRCPRCGAVARPNVLMFGDDRWIVYRSDEQGDRYGLFLAKWLRRVVVIELGAGTAVATVRGHGESLKRQRVPLVRINLREPEGATVGLAMGARDAIAAIEAAGR